jgi:hypothetical protein
VGSGNSVVEAHAASILTKTRRIIPFNHLLHNVIDSFTGSFFSWEISPVIGIVEHVLKEP